MREDDSVISATRLLQNAAHEMDDMAGVLGNLEQLAWELTTGPHGLAAARSNDLQAFDLLAQRIAGLSACLAALAGHIEDAIEIPASRLASLLPLAKQRDALLKGPQAAVEPSADAPPELF